MNGRIYTNFERNLAMMVMYVPVKFELDWSNRFRVPETKMWTDRWMDRKTDKNEETDGKTDKQTDGISPISKGT